MTEQLALSLSPPPPSNTVIINSRCTLRIEGEQRVVVVSGLPVHHYSANDVVAEAYATVFLVDPGFAKQREVARAFGCSVRTVRRHQQRYADKGMTALGARSGWRPGRRRIPTKRRRVIELLHAEGLGNREIARRLGVTENAIRKQVGPSEQSTQAVLPLPMSEALLPTPPTSHARNVRSSTDPQVGSAMTQASASEQRGSAHDGKIREEQNQASMSLDVDPSDRSFDRLLASFGVLDDAAPLFREGTAVIGAGVMVSIPLLVHSGIFRIVSKLYGEIGPAFYGLRTPW